METRRLEAALLFEAGETPAAVARKCEVSRTSASRWKALLDAGTSYRSRKAPGRPCRLSGEQLLSVHALWETRARWTCETFAEAIRVALGVKYDPDHVGRLMLRLGLREKRGYRRLRLALVGTEAVA